MKKEEDQKYLSSKYLSFIEDGKTYNFYIED